MAAGTALRWLPLDQCDWDQAAAAFTRCYEGYVIPIAMTASDLRDRFDAEDVDRSVSHVILDGADVAALGVVARRGRRSRLAAFGVAPPWRDQRLGTRVIEGILAEAGSRGDEAMELEVFAHNPAAIRLYERHGFVATDRLLGFEKLAPAETGRDLRLAVVDPRHLPARLATEAALPWQLQWVTLLRQNLPWEFVGRGDGALALVDRSREAAVQLRFIYTPPALRRAGHARRLLAAIEADAGGRPVRIAQLVPSSLEDAMQRLGFVPGTQTQWRMTKAFLAG